MTPALPLGHVLPLSRRLSASPDPLAWFADLTEQGTRPDTLLLESADCATGADAGATGGDAGAAATRSIIIPRCAVRVEARGSEVTAVALTPNGLGVIEWMRGRLAERVVEAEASRLRLRFPLSPRESSEHERLRAPSVLDALRALILDLTLTARPSALPLLVAGVLSYDLVDSFEALPAAQSDPHSYPDYVFWLPEVMATVDHRDQSVTVLAHVFGGPETEKAYADAVAAVEALSASAQSAPRHVTGDGVCAGADLSRAACDLSDAAYEGAVEEARRHIVAGDVFQIVPSREFSLPCPDPLAAYARLRRLNPSPYMFFVRRSEDVLFGASPETSVKLSGRPRRVEIRPIAGTRPRGRAADGRLDPDLDARYEVDLRLDAKEVAEHMMLVDLARNDVARVSVAGTRTVDRLLVVDRYSHVMHLVSYVSGQMRPDLDCLHAYAASMNMGTLVGAPKVMAAALLRGLEAARRGPYGGAVGWISCDGDMDTAIVIRSALVRDGTACVRAGAGVVYDSVPRSEALETRRKAEAVLRALRSEPDAAQEVEVAP